MTWLTHDLKIEYYFKQIYLVYYKINRFRKELEIKATLADAFIERFQLTPAEIKALRVSKENVVSEVRIKMFLF